MRPKGIIMRKRFLWTLLLVLTVMVSLMGCTSSSPSGAFDKKQVISAAHEVINSLQANDDRMSFFTMASDELKTALTKDQLNDAITQVMPNAGSFKKFKNDAVVWQKDSSGNDVAVAVCQVDYENQKVTYTIGFDTQMKMIAFFLK